MAVCITGMHRSGTSMVTSLLREAGVDFGDAWDFIPASPSNPDGYLENKHFIAINDRLLEASGGSWAAPPASLRVDTSEAHVLRDRARALIRTFHDRQPWGWKDPRNALTLPFWTAAIGDMKVVICVRHPSAVLQSLERAGYFPPWTIRDLARAACGVRRLPPNTLNVATWRMGARANGRGSWWERPFSQIRMLLSSEQRAFYTQLLSIRLWQTYNERALASTAPMQRIVTHYEAYFRDAPAELRRVLRFIGVPASDELVARCCSIVTARLCHSRADVVADTRARVTAESLPLYRRLCDEAGFPSTRDGERVR